MTDLKVLKEHVEILDKGLALLNSRRIDDFASVLLILDKFRLIVEKSEHRLQVLEQSEREDKKDEI